LLGLSLRNETNWEGKEGEGEGWVRAARRGFFLGCGVEPKRRGEGERERGVWASVGQGKEKKVSS